MSPRECPLRGRADFKGDYDRAIADYGQAISLNPKYDPAYNHRGNAYTTRATTTAPSPTSTSHRIRTVETRGGELADP